MTSGSRRRRSFWTRIQTKTSLALVLTSACLIALLHVLSNVVTRNGFADLEERLAVETLARLEGTFSERVDALHMKSADWAVWDDTWYFITDHNEAYAESNLQYSALSLLGINVMMFIDNSREVVAFRAWDVTGEQPMELPPAFAREIADSRLGFHDDPAGEFSGTWVIDGLPMVLSSRAIVKSSGDGPVNGTLVFARFVDSGFMGTLGESTGLSLSLALAGDGPDGVAAQFAGLSPEAPYSVSLDSHRSMTGMVLLNDIAGKPIGAISAQMERPILAYGQSVVNTYNIIQVILVLALCIVSVVLVRIVVVRRLTAVSTEVSGIGMFRSFDVRLERSGSDEIGDLSDSINTMLEELRSSQMELARARDVLELRVAERTVELEDHKKLVDSILAALPSATLLVDSGGRIVHANSAFLAQGTQAGAGAPGAALRSLVNEEPLAEALDRVRTRRSPTQAVEFRKILNGRDSLLRAEVIPMHHANTLVIISDVTEDRARQERLYLSDRLASVGEMAAGVAHELNNPLTSIVGLATLLEEGPVPDEWREDLRSICAEAQRAAQIVKGLLGFARRHEIARRPVCMDDLLDDVLKLRAPSQKRNGIEVEHRRNPESPVATIDYFQMQQVFLNVILNAEQAMVEAHGKGRLVIGAERVDGVLRVSVADDGPGIRPENLGRVFDPFFTTKEVGKGTGLGLSICYGIVSAHSGRIYAESEYGKGATFVVELPLHDAKA